MKNILYLSFYFEPDLCAGSFRNTPLVKELARKTKGDANIDVVTTLPNRYASYEITASQYESYDNINIVRIKLPLHQSGMKDQIFSFKTYYQETLRYVKDRKYDLVIASSSRLFTAYLGYKIAKQLEIPLYLDIRDIFYDTLEDVLSNKLTKKIVLPVIKYIEKRTFEYASHINLISEGFEPYFRRYSGATYSYFPNGIDDVFIDSNIGTHFNKETDLSSLDIKTIVYAGNIGEGQGLHKIIPQAAKELGDNFRFIIIGDGGSKVKLEEELKLLNIRNVEIRPPVNRSELINQYKLADFLFVHLNDYKAFEKVLPSKLFELATFPKPIIAGVGGYANSFVKKNIQNAILFNPCDVDAMVNGIKNYKYKTEQRKDFIMKFRRGVVNERMADTMVKYL